MCEAGDGLAGNCFRQTYPGTGYQVFDICGSKLARNVSVTIKGQLTAKISIVLDEADETAFWLEFIIDENLLKETLVKPLLHEAEELTAIFASSRKTASTKN